jgi:hypothetical protein
MKIASGLLVFLYGFFISTACFAEAIDPPFKKDLQLNIEGANLILGYTSVDEVHSMFGKPRESEIRKTGGEEFYWENMLKYEYLNGKITMIFSIDKQILIQLIYRPAENDVFTSAFGINEQCTRTSVLKILQDGDKTFSETKSGSIWVWYYSQDDPPIYVSMGIGFNSAGKIKTINYLVNSPW